MKTIFPLVILILSISSCKESNKKYLTSENIETVETNADTISTQKTEVKEQSEISHPIDFVKIQPDSIKTNYKKDSIQVNQSLWYNNIQLITGTIENNKNGFHLIVKDSKGKILYKSEGQIDSWRYNPTLFKSEQSKRIIIVNEIGAEESWGIYIHEYNNNVYREIGGLDIVALNEYQESLNVVPFIKIHEIKDSVLQFSFDQKSKIFDLEAESTIDGNKLLYQYKNNTLKRIKPIR
ncbi:hypothetical protein [Aquimarina latercula]|uniref:hypothetical protein n=1 Tax=Aquimarina latercula TaxID=987 RepID=UPI00041DD193|nr:hypothetical protein [Aquimarina latercula]